ncbi:MAG: hypothetical protein WCK67_05490 [bacterium]
MKKFIITFIILMALSFTSRCFAAEKTIEKEYKNGILSIHINQLRPDGVDEKKYEAYKILKPYLNNKLLKAAVIWREDELSYGVEVSISHSYISQKLKRRITTEKFIDKFQINFIEPDHTIIPNNLVEVSSEEVRQSKRLRENADVFRHHQDYEAALRTYLQALEHYPSDCVSLYRIAEIYQFYGQLDTSEAYCKKIEQINPNFANWTRNKLKSSN